MTRSTFTVLCITLLTACSAHLLDVYSPPSQNQHAITFTSQKVTENRYLLIAEHVPPGMQFTITSKTPGREYARQERFTSDSDGRLIASDSSEPRALNDRLQVFTQPKPGQPYDFWLRSEDNSTSLHTTIVPQPIDAKADDGASVMIVCKTDDATIIDCVGSGFRPNERLAIISRSGIQVVSDSITCSSKGEFLTHYFPSVIGQAGGFAHLEVIRQDRAPLTLDYAWGLERNHEIKQIYTFIPLWFSRMLALA